MSDCFDHAMDAFESLDAYTGGNPFRYLPEGREHLYGYNEYEMMNDMFDRRSGYTTIQNKKPKQMTTESNMSPKITEQPKKKEVCMFETTSGPVQCGTVAIIYGTPGCGKTSMVAMAAKETGEKAIFIPVVEDGLSPLQKEGGLFDLSGINRLPKPIQKWSDPVNGGLVEVLRWLVTPEQLAKYDMIVIDSLNLILSDLEEHVFNKYFVTNPEYTGKDANVIKAMAYGFGKNGLINHMASEWQTVVKALRFLKSHNKTVLITTHRGVRKVKLVDQDVEFDSYNIDLPQTKGSDLAGMLIAEADIVGYGKRDVTAANVKKGKGVGVGGDNRVIVLQESATIMAKRRTNTEDEIELSWDSLKRYL